MKPLLVFNEDSVEGVWLSFKMLPLPLPLDVYQALYQLGKDPVVNPGLTVGNISSSWPGGSWRRLLEKGEA